VLAELSHDYRQVIRLRSWDRLSFVEIGEQLGCTADAARKLWLRAIERFERLWSAFESGS
jgi:RNA polymerase sigma-70 factor, ECF subfamily